MEDKKEKKIFFFVTFTNLLAPSVSVCLPKKQVHYVVLVFVYRGFVWCVLFTVEISFCILDFVLEDFCFFFANHFDISDGNAMKFMSYSSFIGYISVHRLRTG